jgi:hypothetical protein
MLAATGLDCRGVEVGDVGSLTDALLHINVSDTPPGWERGMQSGSYLRASHIFGGEYIYMYI